MIKAQIICHLWYLISNVDTIVLKRKFLSRATRSLKRQRRWARSGKHLLLTSPFAPKRGSRYFMLNIHLMLFLVIFMAKKESRWSWLKWFSLNATKVAIYSWFLYDEIDLEFKTANQGEQGNINIIVAWAESALVQVPWSRFAKCQFCLSSAS